MKSKSQFASLSGCSLESLRTLSIKYQTVSEQSRWSEAGILAKKQKCLTLFYNKH